MPFFSSHENSSNKRVKKTSPSSSSSSSIIRKHLDLDLERVFMDSNNKYIDIDPTMATADRAAATAEEHELETFRSCAAATATATAASDNHRDYTSSDSYSDDDNDDNISLVTQEDYNTKVNNTSSGDNNNDNDNDNDSMNSMNSTSIGVDIDYYHQEFRMQIQADSPTNGCTNDLNNDNDPVGDNLVDDVHDNDNNNANHDKFNFDLKNKSKSERNSINNNDDDDDHDVDDHSNNSNNTTTTQDNNMNHDNGNGLYSSKNRGEENESKSETSTAASPEPVLPYKTNILHNVSNDHDNDNDNDNNDNFIDKAIDIDIDIKTNNGSYINVDGGKKRRKKKEPQLVTIINFDGDVEESTYAFCCYKCNCSKEKRQRFLDSHISCGSCGNNNISHRYCCHSILESHAKEEWDSPIMKAIQKDIASSIPKSKKQYLTMDELNKKIKQAEREEVMEQNRNSLEANDQMIYTNEIYLKYCQYHRHLENAIQQGKKERLGPLVVLDLFSGIGSAIVVLKKLEIAISTVICVEHDPVASWVTKSNHDKRYKDNNKGKCNENGPDGDNDNDNGDDGINYVYQYTTFEELEENIAHVIDVFGPIDLVLGGPPCADYSQINAYRKGTNGESGKYLIRFGQLIKKIQNLQEKHLFFLSENVVADSLEMSKMESVYGLPHVRLDAKDYSPCKRDRIYWINLPLSALPEDDLRKRSVPELEGGEMATACVLKHSNMVVKANTFLASECRLDDTPRMMVVKRENSNGEKERFRITTFTVRDREVMMGFPVGYVFKPLKELYSTLKRDAFGVEFENGASWHSRLDPKYHHFCNCDFKFEPSPNDTEFPYEIQIGTQREHRKEGYYLNCEKYAKRLLGNAWSLPVVEELLSPLRQICEKRKYSDYDYVYPWPPHNLI